MTSFTRLTLGTVLAIPALLAAHGAEPAPHRVAIEYQDLTGTQGPSSAPFVSHVAGMHLWEVGKPAGIPLQVLAEDDNPEWMLGAAVSNAKGEYGDVTMGLPVAAGGRRRVELQVDERHPMVSDA